MITYYELDQIVDSIDRCRLVSNEYNLVQQGFVQILNDSDLSDQEVIEYVNTKIREYGCWSQLTITGKRRKTIKCNIR